MWHIQNFASPSLKKFPLPAQETNLSNPPCQVISFSLNHVPSGTAYWQFSISFLSVANARSCSPIAAKFSSPHISSLTDTARLLPSPSTLHTLTSFCFLLRFSIIAWQNSVLVYFFIFSFILFMGLYSHASSFLLLLSLMHFLCHSVLQAFPQIPSSLPVSTLTVSLGHCPRKSIFFQVRKLFKVQFLYCTWKAEAFPPPL